MPAIIEQFLIGSDNYAVLVHDLQSGATTAIDAMEAGPIQAVLEKHNWRLTDILVTHRHADHTNGIPGLKAVYGCRVHGPAKAASEIPGLDHSLREGDTVKVGTQEFGVWETPGHCADHISYLLPRDGTAFVGDTMFPMGCGRIFDSTAAALHKSLMRLATLADDTKIYCGHEYTLANAKFALTVDPDNPALKKRVVEVAALREAGRFTVPTTIGIEKATNPYLRVSSPGVQKALGMEGADPVAVTAELRERKNKF